MSATRKPKPTAGTGARRRAYYEQQARLAASRTDVTARMIEKYKTEPDRAYAEEFWGEMLRERGIDTAAL